MPNIPGVGKLAEQGAALLGIGVKGKPKSDAADENITIDRLTTTQTPERWNEVHTYYFAATMADANGRVTNNFKPIGVGPAKKSIANVISQAVNNKGSIVKSKQADSVPDFAFSRTIVPLAIPPQSLNINVQFASSVQATNRGIVEENNGVVFRTITISGTTGLWKARHGERDLKTPASGKFNLASIFPNAAQAITDLKTAAKRVIGSDGQSAKSANLPEEDLRQTGYYQFWSLHNFFLEYAHNKKQRGANKLRLMFASPKDNITYIVTPVSFDLRRDSANPLLYRYSIQLRAWDVTSASAVLSTLDEIPDGNKPFSLRDVAERIRRARKAINAASNVIKAVQSDVFEALNVVNQATLAVKDIVGVTYDLLDFAPTLKNSIDIMIASNKAQWSQIFQDRGFQPALINSFRENGTGGNKATSDAKNGVGNNASENSAITSLKAQANGGLESSSSNSTNSAPTGEGSSNDLTDSASSAVIGEFLDNAELAEGTPLEDLGTLPESLQKAIDDQIEGSQQITASDIYELAGKLKEISENISYSTGMMDETYTQLYGLPAPTVSDRQPTDDDILLSAQIEDGRDAFLATLATGTVYGERKDNPFVDANSVLPDEAQLPTPISAIPVFVQRGSNLDDMAKYYLGDANRAREIAIINELRAPYIDEEGFNMPIFLANDRSFVVNGRTNLVLNQPVRITGTGLKTTRRTILAIEDLGGGQFKVVVDGQPNLALYNPTTSPFLNARIPGTVGSGDTILIPTGNDPDQPIAARSTSLLERMNYAEKTFRVDIALDETGDLAIGPDGDLSRSFGYKNAVQALQLAVTVEKGELEQHLDYGLPANIGDSLNGDVVSEINESVRASIISDPRFKNADVSAELDGTALRIRVDAEGSNGTGLIPVEFKVTT